MMSTLEDVECAVLPRSAPVREPPVNHKARRSAAPRHAASRNRGFDRPEIFAERAAVSAAARRFGRRTALPKTYDSVRLPDAARGRSALLLVRLQARRARFPAPGDGIRGEYAQMSCAGPCWRSMYSETWDRVWISLHLQAQSGLRLHQHRRESASDASIVDPRDAARTLPTCGETVPARMSTRLTR